MPTEADTCRTLTTPKLQAAGWDSDPPSITEQRYFTDGRVVVHGSKARRGIDFETVAAHEGKPRSDPFDLLCHLAFNAPEFSRRQRADRVRKQELAFFNYFAPEAREILNDLLEKYAADGELQFRALYLPPRVSRSGWDITSYANRWDLIEAHLK